MRVSPLTLPSVLTLWLALAACQGIGESGHEIEGVSNGSETVLYRYNRDYVFVATEGEAPLIVPFTFRATDRAGDLERGALGWLARGGTWDRFLDESGTTSRAGGVWRVVPQGGLRITAGGPTEVESLRFQRGERRLRLDLNAPMTSWNQASDTRFRVITGRLSIGAETVTGPVLEMLRVEQAKEDGWPPGEDFDAIFLTSGDSIQILMAETFSGEGGLAYAWTRTPAGEREWRGSEIRWVEVRPYQEARRDIPRRWTFRIPAADVVGEIEALGFDAVLGPERGARRAVEIRYTVEGWMETQGERRVVRGMIRHTQQ